MRILVVSRCQKMETKICIDCKKTKNVDEFYDGYRRCKPCRTIYEKNIRVARKLTKDENKKDRRKLGDRVKELEKVVEELSDIIEHQEDEISTIKGMIRGFISVKGKKHM